MKRNSGFTLVELMTTLVIIGILTTVGAPAYKQYVVRSKIAEAYVALDEITKNQITGFYELGRFLGTTELNSYTASYQGQPSNQGQPTDSPADEQDGTMPLDPRIAAEKDPPPDEGDGKDPPPDEGGNETVTDSYSFQNITFIGKTTAAGADCTIQTCGGVQYASSTEPVMLKGIGSDGQACGSAQGGGGVNARQILTLPLAANHDWATLSAVADLDFDNSDGRCTTVFRTIQAGPETDRIPKASPLVNLNSGS